MLEAVDELHSLLTEVKITFPDEAQSITALVQQMSEAISERDRQCAVLQRKLLRTEVKVDGFRKRQMIAETERDDIMRNIETLRETQRQTECSPVNTGGVAGVVWDLHETIYGLRRELADRSTELRDASDAVFAWQELFEDSQRKLASTQEALAEVQEAHAIAATNMGLPDVEARCARDRDRYVQDMRRLRAQIQQMKGSEQFNMTLTRSSEFENSLRQDTSIHQELTTTTLAGPEFQEHNNSVNHCSSTPDSSSNPGFSNEEEVNENTRLTKPRRERV